MKTSIRRLYSLIITNLKINKYIVLSISIPLFLRLIPEILMGPWPAGFDVITYYAPYIYDVKRSGFLSPFIVVLASQTAPLSYFVMGAIAYLIPLDSLSISKALSPAIYGLLGFSVYWFAKKYFGWNSRKAFLTVLVSTLYFATLRFSWDMWKNTLGIVFFLLAIGHVKTGEYRKFGAYSVLCILSHDLMAIFLGLIVTVVLVIEVAKNKSHEGEKLFAFLFVVTLSFVGAAFYAGLFKILPQVQPNIPSELILHKETLTIPYNYLSVGNWYGYQSEWDARGEACILMFKMFCPILPLAILGWKKDLWITPFAVISVFPFLSVILMPTMAVPIWHRFAFLLTIPLAFYATVFIAERKKLKILTIAVLLIFMSGYVFFTPENAFPYYALSPSTYKYMPTSMLQNSFSREDSVSVFDSMNWLNQNAVTGSCILVHESFQGWVDLYINREDVGIIPYNMSLTIPSVAQNYYYRVYLVWWARNTNQHEWNPSTEFSQIEQIGRISVYEYRS